MQTEHPTTEQSHIDAGDGVERSVTEARGGVRRGMGKILAISTVLAVVAIGAVWILAAHPTRPALSAQTTQPSALAEAPQANALKSRAWDQAHLGADGMKKCSAFRRVLKDTTEMRGAGHAPMSASQITLLEEELNTARSMPPVSLTPFQCGVPLG